MEYTKGEWKVFHYGDVGQKPSAISVITDDEKLLCKLGIQKEWEANAHLIAAAPELYEALKAAIRIIEVEHIVVPVKCIEALAKAEGKGG
jgi:hypothetical protein